MESLSNILNSIQQHSNEETRQGVKNRAIARGNIHFTNGILGDKEIWITNENPKANIDFTHDITGAIAGVSIKAGVHTLPAKFGASVGKNTQYGRILLYNFDGQHSCLAPAGRLTFDIHNSTTYYSVPSGIFNLSVGISTNANRMNFKDIKDALNAVGMKMQTLLDKQKAEEESKRRAEELAHQQAEERKRQEEEQKRKLQEARDAEERRRTEEEAKRLAEELARQQEEAKRKAEEEARLAEEERKKTEENLNNIIQKYAQAVSFIREQANLKNNPVLDMNQDDAKFSNVYDGSALVIDGGPGTGKTTTLIQRLKFLISAEDLKDYRDNHENCKLGDKDIQLVNDQTANWIFFSPTNLLRRYLDSNMQYEGLTQTSTKTKVWEVFLKDSLRDVYHLAGSDDLPFVFEKKKMRTEDMFLGVHMDIVQSFTDYFINNVKKTILDVAEIDFSKFSWKQVGYVITQQCKQAENVYSIQELLRLLWKLHEYKTLDLNGVNEKGEKKNIINVPQISTEYYQGINKIVTSYITEWKKDESFYDSLLDLMEKWTWEGIPDDDPEIDYDALESRNNEILLVNNLRALFRKIALRQKSDKQVKFSPKNKELLGLITDKIDETKFEALSDFAYFIQYVNPVIKNPETYIFGKLTSFYKNFRRDIIKNNSMGWNIDMLKMIVEKWNNRPLHVQEQALLFGFINNLMHTIYKVSALSFNNTKHKYAIAFKETCRPVIGIDEATDYSMIDYYAISSMRHFKISSFTLTGDIMQCLHPKGVSDWNDLRHPLIFPSLEIKKLLVSYRQSPKLMKLAESLYEDTMKTKYPYRCYLSTEENTPAPLWFDSNDEEEKASWIINRVLEVRDAYNMVPSIAIFVNSESEARNLKELLEEDEDERFSDAGITVKDCSNGEALSDKNTVRIFTLDKVKGLEFEVVFFHNIHKIQDQHLLDKYLYVGLSRATFFMGVTADCVENNLISSVKDLFDVKGNWMDISSR